MVNEWLKVKFCKRFIRKDSWPLRSPNINPCDFFLRGYLRVKIYSLLPNTLDELKANIKREVRSISPEVLVRVFENFRERLKKVTDMSEGHIKEKQISLLTNKLLVFFSSKWYAWE